MQKLGSKQFNKVVSAYLTNTSKNMMEAVAKAVAKNYEASVKEDLANASFMVLEKAVKSRKRKDQAMNDELVKELDEEIARKATEKPVVGQ